MNRFTPVFCLVAVSALAAAPDKAHPTADPLDDVAMGRVGEIWFSDRIVSQLGASGLEVRKQSYGVWSNVDFRATLSGNTIVVDNGYTHGEFVARREGDVTVYDGTLGLDYRYPVTIRISKQAIDMHWGFYERHLTAEYSPQAPIDCIFYAQRAGPTVAFSINDELQVCGAAIDGTRAPVQTLLGFLTNGFRRFDASPAIRG